MRVTGYGVAGVVLCVASDLRCKSTANESRFQAGGGATAKIALQSRWYGKCYDHAARDNLEYGCKCGAAALYGRALTSRQCGVASH